MGIEYEGVINHPLAEVFAWHTRPGAMTRLVPPWHPMKVVAETESLADVTAVLELPAGLRWVAQLDPQGFGPPHLLC
jgi:ligand-binding SRPBCC domain-containing protein